MRHDITRQFGQLYDPFKALLIYRSADRNNVYVEAFDIGADGKPLNAHPLTVQESISLSQALDTSEDLQTGFLEPEGLLTRNMLYINRGRNPFALWQTPAQKVRLLFSESLSIPPGEAFIPPMVWKAGRSTLHTFALNSDEPVSAATTLCNAPFFNVYSDGKVCLGNVNINIPGNCGLEAFMRHWETYFFNSFFSHSLAAQSPIKGNIVQLWQKLVNTNEPFPMEKLIPTKLTIKDLLK